MDVVNKDPNILYERHHISQFSSSASATNSIAIHNNFRIAIITAGGIRSFAFVAASWKRYLYSNSNKYKHKIYLFAHVVVDDNCPIHVQGLKILRHMCTDIEVYPQHSTLVPSPVVMKSIPDFFQTENVEIPMLTSVSKGNIIDTLP
jgi:hypothetical protein